MAYITVIQPEDSEGSLKQIYSEISSSRGKIAEVHKIQSLNPLTIRTHMDFYQSIMFSRSPLSRAQREMMAVVVSAVNGCSYCIEHHRQALLHYWKDEDRTLELVQTLSAGDLSELDRLLCAYAQRLTLQPGATDWEEWVGRLHVQGLDDRGVLDVSLVVGYFNYVNRIVLSLGVELEEQPGGYRY